MLTMLEPNMLTMLTMLTMLSWFLMYVIDNLKKKEVQNQIAYVFDRKQSVLAD